VRTAIPALVFAAMSASACTTPQRSSDIRWAGWVLSSLPAAEGNTLLETGEVEITWPDGTHLGAAEPSESSPGFYSLSVPADEEISLRISGKTLHTTVWRTRTPRANGFWIYGSVFGVDVATLDIYLDAVVDLTADEIPWQEDQAGALIYGTPTIRDAEDEAAWTGAQLTALDSEGGIGTVIALAQDPETGAMGLATGPSGILGPNHVDGPIALIIAYDLAPGPVRLIVEGSDGRTAVADWVSQDGDVLSAAHLTLPSVDR